MSAVLEELQIEALLLFVMNDTFLERTLETLGAVESEKAREEGVRSRLLE